MRTSFGIGPVLALAVLAGCGGPPPHFDSNIGLKGVPGKPGALAGTFGLFVEISYIVDAPIVGQQPGGGDSWFLVTRTYDAKTRTYAERHVVCGGTTFDIAGNKATIPISSWRDLAPKDVQKVDIEDATGSYAISGHLEMWGLAGVPDPWTTPLPASPDGYQQPPAKGWVTDMDKDGMPGMTVHIDGFISGDVFFVQRRILNLTGVVLGPDKVVGIAKSLVNKVVLGATSGLLDTQAPTTPDPNPKKSWFEADRVDPSTDCQALTDMVDSGKLGGSRPFPF